MFGLSRSWELRNMSISMSNDDKPSILKKWIKSKTRKKRMAAGVIMCHIMKDMGMDTKDVADYIGVAEVVVRRCLFHLQLNVPDDMKPAWMQSVLQMRDQKTIREDGSARGWKR